MLIFNDGKPRSGKSYDAVKNHVLPALKAGRPVYARLDGLDHEKIAAYLGLSLDRIRELLHHIPVDQVVTRCRCTWEGEAGYVIPDEFRNALVIIDEVHEFYPAGLKALEPEQEKFFARHGQFGMDIIVASQTFGRLHSEIRARVERKVLFRKLSHFAALEKIGIGGKKRYSMRFSVDDGEGKYKVIGSKTESYDPAIFPLYAGYQPGTTNTEVYEGGKQEAGGMGLKFYVPLALVLAAVGVWYMFRFFDPATSGMVKKEDAARFVDVSEPRGRSPGGTAANTPAVPVPNIVPEKKYENPGVAYVMRMMKDHRPRVVGKWQAGSGKQGGWIELVSSQGHAAERMDIEQWAALGFEVRDEKYGYSLHAEGETIIATAWPQDRWGTVPENIQQRLADGAGPRESGGTHGGKAQNEGDQSTSSVAILSGAQATGYGDLGKRDISPATGGTIEM